MGGYKNFASVYDILTDYISYPKRAKYFDSIITKFGNGKKGILLDLACGSGSLSVEFAKLGYDVIGCDSSEEMLAIAQNKQSSSRFPITYICQPMEKLDLYGTVDCIVCALDSLNHITDISILETVFSKAALFLESDGVFVFDVNTCWKHKEVLGNNTFVYDYEDVYLVWKNTLLSNNVVQIDLDIFKRYKNGYQRYEESFCERAYSKEELNVALKKAGFEISAIYKADTQESPSYDTQRVVYVVKKGGTLD